MGKEKCIYLVICLMFFSDKLNEDVLLIYDEYIVEICIYYVFDLGNIYCLLDEKLICKENLDLFVVWEMVKFNFCFLLILYKKDMVVGNDFYFVN